MGRRRGCISACAVACFVVPAKAALLSMEFAGGLSEVTLGPQETVRIDIVWTMQATDTAKYSLTEVDLRFNVNDVPDPDGTDRNSEFIVQSASTSIPEWTLFTPTIVGGFFSESFFLAAGHEDGAVGIEGNGTEFRTVVASFFLSKETSVVGDTYITFRHRNASDILPFAADGVPEWPLRWQTDVDGPFQFDLGLGNPGDAGPQWDPLHGYEIFQPLIVHSIPEPASVLWVLCAGLALMGMSGRQRWR